MKGQHNQKYSYSGVDVPTNNGSILNPGRITIRCNCTERARYKRAIHRIAVTFGMTDQSQSAVWTAHVLPMIEQFSWRQNLAKTAKRTKRG